MGGLVLPLRRSITTYTLIGADGKDVELGLYTEEDDHLQFKALLEIDDIPVQLADYPKVEPITGLGGKLTITLPWRAMRVEKVEE